MVAIAADVHPRTDSSACSGAVVPGTVDYAQPAVFEVKAALQDRGRSAKRKRDSAQPQKIDRPYSEPISGCADFDRLRPPVINPVKEQFVRTMRLRAEQDFRPDRKSTRLNSSHRTI